MKLAHQRILRHQILKQPAFIPSRHNNPSHDFSISSSAMLPYSRANSSRHRPFPGRLIQFFCADRLERFSISATDKRFILTNPTM
jgi:hypothetical protein